MAAKKKKPAGKAKAQAAPPPLDLAKAFRESYVPPPPSAAVVNLDPDVARHFRDSRAVNEVLRALLRIVRQVRDTV